ncbi:hypothetical protein QVD17_13452 [Tagetes erecta]|uniref:MBD domain-containing protein n=1 Tax=Tagetes erecta TaxID=13708 RepID=A0AAD8P3A5_TARER|nr:hypothetical protein QVD17_13452 [Tagetes erecta]
MGPDDWPEWLPADWTVHLRKIDGRKVKCYVDPDGHKCYSKPQVFDYLKKTNKSIPNENTQNADEPAIDLSVEPNAPQTDEVPQSTPGGHLTKLTPRTSRRKTNPTDLSEDFLAGDGSSSEPLSRSGRSSRKRHTGDTSWLPADWTVEEKIRKAGSSTGMKYKIYTEPITGRKFFSKPQVLKYLGKTDDSAGGQEAVYTEPISVMPISSWQETPTTEPDNSQIYEATGVGKKTEKKSESSRFSSDYEVVSRTPVEGLPPGWIKEVRMKKSGSRKDAFYLDPSSEYAFFSKKDALRYLESGDVIKCVVKPLKRDMNKDNTINVNLTSSGAEVTPPPDRFKGAEASKEDTNGSVEELKTNGSGIENPKPVRSITGGSFSTPDTNRKAPRSATAGSFYTSKEDSDWLPEGWLVDVRYKNSGMKYKIYKEPTSGKLFYSKPQVLSYLGIASNSNSRKRKEHNSSVAPNSSPNSTPADGKRPKRSAKKKGSSNSENTDFQEIITTSAADGLPEGWVKETRTRLYATHKRSDPFYTDPVTGYIFRSKLDALRFLETGDVNLCAIRPKVKDKDGNEVFVYTTPVQNPTNGDSVPSENPEQNQAPDPKTADNTTRRASTRVTKNTSPPANSPSRSSKRQKGKGPETTPAGPTEGNGAGQEKQETGVNLEKQPTDDGNLAFDIPEDDNWTDQCIDFAVKTLTNEILFNGQPVSGGFPEENAGVETTGVKDTTPTKVN